MRDSLETNFQKYRSLVLLFALVGVILALPLDTVSRLTVVLIRVAYLITFCVGGYLLHSERWWLTSYISVAIPTLLLGLLDLSPGENLFLYLASRILTIVLQLLLIFAVFRFSLFRPAARQGDRILAGICGYLIIGLLWMTFFAMIETLSPGSFRNSSGAEPVFLRDSTTAYYSFVTLTTLGYGEIIPVTPWSRIVASLEAVVGTLYLTVFIATIISGGKEKV